MLLKTKNIAKTIVDITHPTSKPTLSPTRHVSQQKKLKLWIPHLTTPTNYSVTILTLSTSNVSVSTSTTSLVSENDGTATNRTAWPSGP